MTWSTTTYTTADEIAFIKGMERHGNKGALRGYLNAPDHDWGQVDREQALQHAREALARLEAMPVGKGAR
jgi:hypothetical protein